MLKNFLILLLSVFLLFSCSKKNKKEIVMEPTEREKVVIVYQEAVEALKKGDAFYASKKFKEAESLMPQSLWAAKSSLMGGYSEYSRNAYSSSIFILERHIKTYPADKNIPYAHYLITISYYERILDEKKDITPLLKSKERINFFLKNYPNTEYALDLKFKLDLINNQLAAKELYIAKYYIKTQKWIAAVNRLKKIVTDYNETIFIEEALHRLTEV